MKPIHQWTQADILEYLKKIDRKTAIQIGIGAFIFLLIWIFFIYPAWFGRIAVKRHLQETRAQVSMAKTMILKKPEWVKTKDRAVSQVQEAKQRLFGLGETSLLLGTISQMAEDCNVAIVTSRPKKYDSKFPAPYDQQYEGSLYDLTVEGNYHEVGRFIGKVESYSKLLQVRSFDLNAKEDNPRLHIAEISLSAVSIAAPKPVVIAPKKKGAK